MSIKKGVAALVAIGFVAGSMLTPAFGAQYSKQQEQKMLKELNAIRAQKKKIENQKKETKAEANKLANAIDEAKDKIDKLDDKIYVQKKQLTSVRKEAVVTEENLVQTTEELGEQVEVFNSRIKDIYENGSVSYLEVILDSEDFGDLLDRFEYMKAIVEQDSKLLEEIETKQAEIRQKKAELAAKRAKIEDLKASTEEAKQENEVQKEEHARMLDKAKDDLAKFTDEIDKLEEAESRKMADIIRLRQLQDTKPMGKGVMLWPAPGHSRISSPYGWRTHPILRVKKFHRGIDIPAPTGSAVKAAQTGKVIFSGWMNGYGNVIVLDHGGQVSTLYAHLSQRNVNVGSSVEKGDIIAEVGSTGRSTGPHLHFEVRQGGEPVNPVPYL